MKLRWSIGQLALIVVTCQLVLLGLWLLHSIAFDRPGPFSDSFYGVKYDSSYDANDSPVFHLRDEPLTKFLWTTCLVKGSLVEASKKAKRCVCRDSYYGEHCSVPKVVWESPDYQSSWFQRQYKVVLRKRPRRIIHGVPISIELDLLEIRLKMLSDVVDVFLIGESNFTNAGTKKHTLLLDRLKAGWMKHVHPKIVYVFQNQFPPGGKEDGWIADTFMRRFLSTRGFSLIGDLRIDDLFVLADGDELIRPEVLEFLKNHDGYPEPVSFQYRWCIFGFFWPIPPKVTVQRVAPLPAAVTVRFFQELYKLDASLVRQDAYLNNTMKSAVAQYKTMDYTFPIQKWVIGRQKVPAGWHCSWCLRPRDIQRKLLNAPHSDYPRWGDYPPKASVKYIKKLIRHGRFFDLSPLGNSSTGLYDKYYAPDVVLKEKKFEYLVKNLYLNSTSEWRYGMKSTVKPRSSTKSTVKPRSSTPITG